MNHSVEVLTDLGLSNVYLIIDGTMGVIQCFGVGVGMGWGC